MSDIRFSPDYPVWAKPERLDVTFIDMSDAPLSFEIKVSDTIEPEFSLSWWIDIRGDRFYNTTLSPQGSKDANNPFLYSYTLVFQPETSELKRYIWVDIEKESGVPLIKSYLNVFRLDISEFVDKLNDNLKFYGLSDRWTILLSPDLALNKEKMLFNASDVFLWDVLQQTTDIYGEQARWVKTVSYSGGILIKIGYPAVEIEHIFQYGGDTPYGDGGLVNIERTLSAEKLTTILAGRGGERNIPERYFEPEGDNFPGDPDQNFYTASLNLHNLMPKCFRDYNRGWNSKIAKPTETEAYNQGVSDALVSSINKSRYRPTEWVRSKEGVATYGEIWDKLEPMEDIFPTIQGIDAETAREAGVLTVAEGRLDEIVKVGNIGNSDPDGSDYQATFDVYIKDLGFDIQDDKYWAKDDMALCFSSGWGSQSEDYVFKVVRKKPTPAPAGVAPGEGHTAYKLTLFKSDAELDTTGLMIPNIDKGAVPAEGDYFFLINANLPHPYVLIAEKRQEDYLSAVLGKVDKEVPVYTVKPDRIFCSKFDEIGKLFPGAIVRISNKHLITGAYESVHIKSITLKYIFEGRVLPDWEMVITDKISAALNPVQRISSDLSALSKVQLTEANVTAKVAAVGDKRWLRKDGIADVSRSVTKFEQEVSSTNYTGTSFEKAGWALTKHPDYPSESLAVFDHLNVRKTFNVYEIVANQIKYMGGKMIFSATAMEVSKIEDGGLFWKLYFDTKDGQVKNLWKTGDVALCQRFDADNIEIKYYRQPIHTVNPQNDFIEISKNSTATPEVGDLIVQHGHVSDRQRQNILVIDTIGGARFTSIQGLGTADSVGKIVAEMGWIDGSPKFFVGNKDSSYIDFDAAKNLLQVVANEMTLKAPQGNTVLGDWIIETDREILDAQRAAAEALVAANKAQADANASIADYNAKFATMQAQLDGEVSNWYYAYSPTLTNAPANTWLNNAERDRHIGDTFLNTQPYVNNVTTPDAGKAWRYVKNGSIYSWTPISDSDAVKALQEASRAQSTADGKSTTYIVKPTKYSYGDMWVLENDTVHSPNKKGEILFANTTSAIYSAIHWVTKVRYTDDTLAQEARDAANSANTAIGSLNAYVDGAFRDGVIDTSEAKAIAEQIKSVNESKAAADSSYATLYANTLLVGEAKTNLATAKKDIDTKRAVLITSINNIVTNKQITTTLREAYTASYANYTNSFRLFTSRLSEATKSIEDAIKSAADASSAAAAALQKVVDAMNDDEIFSIVEKKAIRTQWELISGLANVVPDIFGLDGSYNKLKTLALTYKVSIADLDKYYQALRAFLEKVSLYGKDATVPFNRVIMSNSFKKYYDEEIRLSDVLSKRFADDVQPSEVNLINGTKHFTATTSNSWSYIQSKPVPYPKVGETYTARFINKGQNPIRISLQEKILGGTTYPYIGEVVAPGELGSITVTLRDPSPNVVEFLFIGVLHQNGYAGNLPIGTYILEDMMLVRGNKVPLTYVESKADTDAKVGVGVRNLIPNANFDTTNKSPWGYWSGGTAISTTKQNNEMQVFYKNSSIFTSGVVTLKKGVEYVLSFYAKTTSATPVQLNWNYIISSSGNVSIGGNIPVTQEWGRYFVKFKPTANITGKAGLGCLGLTGEVVVVFRKWQLEENTIMSDWRDTFTDIDYLKQAFPQSAIFDAGIVLAELLAVRNNAKNIVGGMSGVNFLKDNTDFVPGDLSCPTAFWGAKDVASANTAATRIYPDGRIVTNSLRAENGTTLGDFSISDDMPGAIFYDKEGDIGLESRGDNKQILSGGGMQCIKQARSGTMGTIIAQIGVAGTIGTENPNYNRRHYAAAAFRSSHPAWAGIAVSVLKDTPAIEMMSGFLSGFRLYLRTFTISSSQTITLNEFDNLIFLNNIAELTTTTINPPASPQKGQIYKIVASSRIPASATVKLSAISSQSRFFPLGATSYSSTLSYSNQAICVNLIYDGTAWVVTRESYTP